MTNRYLSEMDQIPLKEEMNRSGLVGHQDQTFHALVSGGNFVTIRVFNNLGQ